MRGRGNEKALQIEAVMARTEPDYRSAAVMLLPMIHRFYQDPENEKEFQEWKKAREAAKEGA